MYYLAIFILRTFMIRLHLT